MPSDTSATDLHAPPARDRALPAGAGLALAVVLGTALWAGILALFLV